jgi:hypothetical protein
MSITMIDGWRKTKKRKRSKREEENDSAFLVSSPKGWLDFTEVESSPDP